MATTARARRLQKELRQLAEDPPEFVAAVAVDAADAGRVLVRLAGLPAPYDGGEYVVALRLPADYPMMPPDVAMLTPNGRFAPGASVCTTFTSYHPESWSPMYTLRTILASFVSFMLDDGDRAHIGAAARTDWTPERRRALAAASVAHNTRAGHDAAFAAHGVALGDAAARAAGQ